VHAIRRAKRHIYIENQYFLGSSHAWIEDKGVGGPLPVTHFLPFILGSSRLQSQPSTIQTTGLQVTSCMMCQVGLHVVSTSTALYYAPANIVYRGILAVLYRQAQSCVVLTDTVLYHAPAYMLYLRHSSCVVLTSSLCLKGNANHLIPVELALKVASKIKAGEPFGCVVVLPMYSEGTAFASDGFLVASCRRRSFQLACSLCPRMPARSVLLQILRLLACQASACAVCTMCNAQSACRSGAALGLNTKLRHSQCTVGAAFLFGMQECQTAHLCKR